MHQLTIVCLMVAASVAAGQFCPAPFVNAFDGRKFNKCYHYLGVENSHFLASQKCASMGTFLVTVKDQKSLEDLYELYKGFPNYYFWVGATASIASPNYFVWQDGTPVDSKMWCSGHPKGGDNTCAFYTTKAVVGRDKCLSTGKCSASFFDHGGICQHGANLPGK